MKRILTIWAALGAAYVVFETLFRGYSHPSMFVVGGLCGVLVGAINQAPRFYRAPVIVQSVIGAVIVLAVEFVSGCVLNLWLGLGVWDYSNQPGNVLGQICPAFGLLWFFIMPLAIWAEDTTRYLIWAYDCAVYHSQEAPPTIAPYSLKSVYCHPYTSCERGSNECANKMIRRKYPKGTDFNKVSRASIKETEAWINNYPREILGWKTSEIVFAECLEELAREA